MKNLVDYICEAANEKIKISENNGVYTIKQLSSKCGPINVKDYPDLESAKEIKVIIKVTNASYTRNWMHMEFVGFNFKNVKFSGEYISFNNCTLTDCVFDFRYHTDILNSWGDVDTDRKSNSTFVNCTFIPSENNIQYTSKFSKSKDSYLDVNSKDLKRFGIKYENCTIDCTNDVLTRFSFYDKAAMDRNNVEQRDAVKDMDVDKIVDTFNKLYKGKLKLSNIDTKSYEGSVDVWQGIYTIGKK